MNRVVINSMFFCHCVDPERMVQIFFEKERATENGGVGIKISDFRHLLFFGDKKGF